MSDNVILLGAGASFDAGIPLLGNFMDRMVEMALTGRSSYGDLTDNQHKVLSAALRIRNTIEPYHARVALDQFNIEQILSVLSFEAFCGSKQGNSDLKDFTRAISTTIELCCNVQHHGKLNTVSEQGPEIYRRFWRGLLKIREKSPEMFPSLLSFNYDLVLERALFQQLIGPGIRAGDHLRTPGIWLDYSNENLPAAAYTVKHCQFGQFRPDSKEGSSLVPHGQDLVPDDYLRIQYLKLHGSLNFPSGKPTDSWSPVAAVDNPKIIPPVFNKSESNFGTPIWKSALNLLKNCKTLVICGYSLPITDTYMQYFLKAALGPNRNLHKIFVFDPTLYSGKDSGRALRDRYDACFSEQFRSRIEFNPPIARNNAVPGTFQHMVELLATSPSQILFGA
jgi:hypothetical protein